MTKASDSPNKFTAKEAAAMQLKVPESGTEWLDRMVIEARRLDAEQFQAKLQENTAPAKTPKSKPQGPKDPPAGGAGTKIG